MRPRTIDQAFEHHKSIDPDSALTKTALRRLVVTGAILSVRIGQKYLVTLEALDAYLAGPVTAPELSVGGIRPIGGVNEGA